MSRQWPRGVHTMAVRKNANLQRPSCPLDNIAAIVMGRSRFLLFCQPNERPWFLGDNNANRPIFTCLLFWISAHFHARSLADVSVRKAWSPRIIACFFLATQVSANALPFVPQPTSGPCFDISINLHLLTHGFASTGPLLYLLHLQQTCWKIARTRARLHFSNDAFLASQGVL